MKKFIFFIFVICAYISPFTAWSACNSIYEKKTNGDQYLESQSPFMNKPAYLQCGGDEQTRCKQDDIVAGNDGYLYKCDINRWKEVNDDEIKECGSVTEIYTAKNKNYPIAKEQNRPSIYLYTKNANSEKISKYCKVSSKFVIQNWDLEFATCDGKEDGVPSGTCSANAVVGGENGSLYKCTSNGWTQEKENIPNCVNQQNAPKNKTFQYSYDDAPAEISGCNYAIQNYCINQVNAPDSTTSSTTGGSKAEAIFEEGLDITGDPEYECTKSGGRDYDPAYGCICDTENDHLVQDTRTYNKIEYSICRCINGYKRKNTKTDEQGNIKYLATGECIPANDYETKQVPNTEKYRQDAENAYRNEYDNAQSWANKGVTAGSTLLTGEGAMMAARAIAEQKADKKAEEQMAEWISKMGCEYGNGQQVNLGKEETLPAGDLAKYYAEYKQLADKLKATKAALNLRPGIEAEVLYDRAETGLYQYQTAERQSGGFTSLSRALMNPDGTDATAWNAQRAETNRDLWVGGALATVGLAGSYIANRAINKDHVKKYKELEEKFREIKIQLEHEYPEIFIPTPEDPAVEEVEEVEVEVEQEPTIEPSPQQSIPQPIPLDSLRVSSEAFKRGYASLTSRGREGINRAIELITNALNDYDIASTSMDITAKGHSDPDGINPDYVRSITNNYKTALGKTTYFTPIDKINTNKLLSEARAQVVVTALLDEIKNRLSPTRNPTYHVDGTDGKECTKPKTQYEQCRYVEIDIELTAIPKAK